MKKIVIKTLPLVAFNYAKLFGVEVKITGDKAFTDGQSINIPRIDETNKEHCTLAYAYVAHEAAHIRYTDFNVVRKVARAKQEILYRIFNILEDARIERLIGKEFVGVWENLYTLRKSVLLDDENSIKSPDRVSLLHNVLLFLLYESSATVQNFKAFVSLANKFFASLVLDTNVRLLCAIRDNVHKVLHATSSDDVYEIAKTIYDIINKEDFYLGNIKGLTELLDFESMALLYKKLDDNDLISVPQDGNFDGKNTDSDTFGLADTSDKTDADDDELTLVVKILRKSGIANTNIKTNTKANYNNKLNINIKTYGTTDKDLAQGCMCADTSYSLDTSATSDTRNLADTKNTLDRDTSDKTGNKNVNENIKDHDNKDLGTKSDSTVESSNLFDNLSKALKKALVDSIAKRLKDAKTRQDTLNKSLFTKQDIKTMGLDSKGSAKTVHSFDSACEVFDKEQERFRYHLIFPKVPDFSKHISALYDCKTSAREDLGNVEEMRCERGSDSILKEVLANNMARRNKLTRKIVSVREELLCGFKRGRKLNVKKLTLLPWGYKHIFKKEDIYVDFHTCVHILVDVSGSMLTDDGESAARYVIANRTALSLALALDGVEELYCAVTFFPGRKSEYEYALKFMQKVRINAAYFDQKPRCSTPLAQALWYAIASFLKMQKKRNIIIVITDGKPDSPTKTKEVLKVCKDLGIEVYGFGIREQDIKKYIEKSIILSSCHDLEKESFDLFLKLFESKHYTS